MVVKVIKTTSKSTKVQIAEGSFYPFVPVHVGQCMLLFFYNYLFILCYEIA